MKEMDVRSAWHENLFNAKVRGGGWGLAFIPFIPVNN